MNQVDTQRDQTEDGDGADDDGDDHCQSGLRHTVHCHNITYHSILIHIETYERNKHDNNIA